MIPAFLRKILKRSQRIKTLFLLGHGLRMKYRLSKGINSVGPGDTAESFSTDKSVSYIEDVIGDYKKYLGIDAFHGSIAEIGPGPNAGVALLMLKDGSKKVDLIDRFYIQRDAQQQSEIYNALSKVHHLDNQGNADLWDDQKLNGIFWHTKESAEEFFKSASENQDSRYDFIVSRAVLEHLYQPLEMLKNSISCLNPGGQLAHKIDFKDHGLYSPELHELTFLTVSPQIWDTISRHTGNPNRVLINRYRTLLSNLQKSVLENFSILVTGLVGVGEITPHKKFEDIDSSLRAQAIDFVEKHRKSFSKEFAGMKSEDLAISGIFLIAQKKCT